MDKLEKQAWDLYVKTRNISEEELADEELCKKLRNTMDYGLCRLHVAMCNFGNEFLRGIGFKI